MALHGRIDHSFTKYEWRSLPKLLFRFLHKGHSLWFINSTGYLHYTSYWKPLSVFPSVLLKSRVWESRDGKREKEGERDKFAEVKKRGRDKGQNLLVLLHKDGFDFRVPASGAVRGWVYIASCHLVWVVCYRNPRKLIHLAMGLMLRPVRGLLGIR